MTNRRFYSICDLFPDSSYRLAAFVFISLFAVSPIAVADPEVEAPPFAVEPPVPAKRPDRTEIPLTPPNGESAEQWEQFLNQRIIRNVNHPALFPVLPDASVANGRAVIVVPGGGYNFIAIENEGIPVARQLADAGYSAYVLKYRTRSTPAEPAAFLEETSKVFRTLGKTRLHDHPPAVADLADAITAVQQLCSEHNCDPARIGAIGFSAGARSIIRLLEHEAAAANLSHVALIYPPTIDAIVAPDYSAPLFVAIAADDPLFVQGGLHLPEAWLAANGSLELHLYAEGSHGFGSLKKGLTASHWSEQYLIWLTRVDAFREP